MEGAPACPPPPRKPPSLCCCYEGSGWCQRRATSPNAAWQLALSPYAPSEGGGGGEVLLYPVARCFGGHCCATCRCVRGPHFFARRWTARPRAPARFINAPTDPHQPSRSQPRPARLRLPDRRALGWSSGWACRRGRCSRVRSFYGCWQCTGSALLSSRRCLGLEALAVCVLPAFAAGLKSRSAGVAR